MLEVRGLSVERGGQQVLRQLTAAFTAGEVHGLIGRNGAGKTTLLDTLAHLIAVSDGHCSLDGGPLKKEDVAYVPSSLTFLPFVSVAEYLDAFNRARVRRGLLAVDVSAWLEAFEIPLNGDAASLSAGMQQAVALIAAMALGRRVLLADELFAALDADRQCVAAGALRGYARAGRCVLVTLHASDLIPIVCDRVHLLSDGQIAQQLTPSPTPDLRRLLAAPDLDSRVARAEQLGGA